MKRTRGQALIEFALVSPILLLLIMGIFDFSRVFITYAVTSNSLRTALRLAEVRGFNGQTDPDFGNCARMESIANNMLFAGARTIQIQYLKPDSVANPTTRTCASGGKMASNLIESGDMLRIRVTATVNFITPLISNMFPALTLNLEGRRTIVNQIQLGSIANVAADSDFDGLLDAWEMQWFGHLNYNATDDLEPDGCNNGCEQSNNTNPLNPDTDGDGIPDGQEVDCGTDPGDGSAVDADGDGLNANLECSLGLDDHNPDWDDDGLTDGYEYYTSRTNPALKDTDGDGLEDGYEVNTLHSNPLSRDTDQDGVDDAREVAYALSHGAAADRMINTYDSDNDGLLDGEEIGYSDGSFAGWGTDPLNPDTDGDGLSDGYELMINDDDPRVMDADDTDPNKWDTDGDRLSDGQEILGTAFSPTCGFILPATDPRNPDTDGDGIEDDIDCNSTGDADHDGLNDAWEALHFITIDMYSGTDDPDNDHCNNICEQGNGTDPLHPDSDGDGLMDGDEIFGTVPGYPGITTNPLAKDSDLDGVWDGDELVNHTKPWVVDSDADGLTDGDELGIRLDDGTRIPGLGTDPTKRDTDSDGLTDYAEIFFGAGSDYVFVENGNTHTYRVTIDSSVHPITVLTRTLDGAPTAWHLDPLNPDSDGDRLSDGDEVSWRTNPFVADTDGDGLYDGDEVATHADPTKWDTDGDGLSDMDEVGARQENGSFAGGTGTRPDNPDTDGDGLSDYDEVFFGTGSGYAFVENGVTRTYQVTINSSVHPIQVTARTLDGAPTTLALDPNHTDSDDDGAFDGDEVLNMHTNPLYADTDGDGLDDGTEKANGTNPLLRDTDGDGFTDYEELNFGSSGYSIVVGGVTIPITGNLNPLSADTDGDGLSDWVETHFAAQNYRVIVNGVTPGTLITGNLNPLNRDTDNDGVNDGPEVTNGTNPLVTDTDGDGMGDSVDTYPLNWPVIALTCQDPTNCTRAEVANTGTNANRFITFRITASYVSAGQTVQAAYATAGGSATEYNNTSCGLTNATGDYLRAAGTATFNTSGTSSRDIQVRICHQLNDEPNETFTFTVAPTGVTAPVTLVTSPASRTGTITNTNFADNDNDGLSNDDDAYPNDRPTLAVICQTPSNCTRAEVANSGTDSDRFITFRISARYVSAGQDVRASYVTASGTATELNASTCSSSGTGDYLRRSGTWTATTGSSSTDIGVRICRQVNNEGNENFTFTITAAGASASVTTITPPAFRTGIITNVNN